MKLRTGRQPRPLDISFEADILASDRFCGRQPPVSRPTPRTRGRSNSYDVSNLARMGDSTHSEFADIEVFTRLCSYARKCGLVEHSNKASPCPSRGTYAPPPEIGWIRRGPWTSKVHFESRPLHHLLKLIACLEGLSVIVRPNTAAEVCDVHLTLQTSLVA